MNPSDIKGSSANKRKRRQLLRMWLEDNRCRDCKQPTVLPPEKGGRHPMSTATIEHIYPRGHPMRHVPANGEKRHTLLCARCNNRRNQEFTKGKPLQELWHASGRYPKWYDEMRAAL